LSTQLKPAELMTASQLAELGLPPPGQGEAYLQVFVLNDKRTNSGEHEGGPFRVATGAIERIGASVVGRPFIVGPDPTRHVRGASGTVEEVLQIQKKYAVGEFVKHFVKAGSNNVYGVVKVFKEFVDKARNGEIPKYSSPMIERYKYDMATGEVTDGRVLHVQGVSVPGYDPAVAKLGVACVGMLDNCMQEIRAVAAAGQLAKFQSGVPGAHSIDDLVTTFESVKAVDQRGIDYDIPALLAAAGDDEIGVNEDLMSYMSGVIRKEKAKETDGLVEVFDAFREV
jgi:hypothetical protein